MWAYLIGLGVLALILITSHLPRSGFNPTAFVDRDDLVESGEYYFLSYCVIFSHIVMTNRFSSPVIPF